MEKMKILFLTLGSISDIKTRGIYTDLMHEFVRLGHEPYIVIAAERRMGLSEQTWIEDGINILRVKTLNVRKSNIIEKGIGTLLLEYQYKSAIKRHWGNLHFDLCLYSTPPITFNKVIAWQKRQGVPTYLLLKDIFPQNAVDLGMFQKNSLFYKYFRRKEKQLYQLSDFVGCMSPANVKYILDNNPDINVDKVEVCPNSLKILSLCDNKTDKKYVFQKYGISNDKTLFIYGGNIGKPQGIDFLIEVLDAIKDRNDLHVCIVGSGTESSKLHAWAKANQPKNVTIKEAIPKEDYDKLVGAADVGMIFLDHRFTIPNFPSRLLSYLENSIPVLLATDTNSDMGQIAMDNGFGLWSESGDLKSFIENINKLTQNAMLRKKMGDNGYKFMVDNYSIENTAAIILNHFD